MILRDIETDEIIIPPYVLLRTEHREVYMNFFNFNQRAAAFKEDEETSYETVKCDFNLIDCDGKRRSCGVNLLPKRFFPKAYQYFTMLN